MGHRHLSDGGVEEQYVGRLDTRRIADGCADGGGGRCAALGLADLDRVRRVADGLEGRALDVGDGGRRWGRVGEGGRGGGRWIWGRGGGRGARRRGPGGR